MALPNSSFERCAADQNDVIVAHALFHHRVDDDLHVGHRRGEKRGHAQYLRSFLFQRFHIGFHGIIDAQINDLETCAFPSSCPRGFCRYRECRP